ncbi:MAG: alpha/beta hydrolase [Bacteroidales bacterium]|nr:alpha/beta hydrolase [Bacteroidales bacterium]
MKASSILVALLALVACQRGPVNPESIQSRLVEEGGTGPYKALMLEDPTLAEHTVFVPQDLSPFGKKNPLPVLVWGNGACVNSPWEHYKFLNEIASHGFLVIATGHIPMTDDRYVGPMSTSAQQIEAIDWALERNADKDSPYYGRIDTKHIAAAGMSCGGLQTLENSTDPRLTTIMVCNSGLFINPRAAVPNMPMPSKEKLQEITVPVIYILGGTEDIAYENGMDDFHRLVKVPAFAANYPVGHGGTYALPHGGEFSVPALGWLKWQLKGDKEAAKLFQGEACGLSLREGWTVEKNALIDK